MKPPFYKQTQGMFCTFMILNIGILISALSTTVRAQHVDVALPYSYLIPVADLADNMEPVHSFHLDILYGLKNSRISFGLGYQVGRYDRFREDELIDIDNQTILAPVIVNHTFSSLMAAGRYDLTEGGPLTPYITIRMGWGFLSSYLQVRDPNREEGSEGAINLFEDNLERSNTFLGGLGAGARFDLAHIFNRISREQLYFNGELSFIAGPAVDYSFSQRQNSVRYSVDISSPSDEYEVVEHSLHNTERYNTAVTMLSLKVGILWRMNLNKRG